MNIILIGYMGSGKSLIGKQLAQKLNVNYIDLDDYIQNKEKASITEIFQNKGEIYFRKIEHQHLKELLSNSTNAVIALGGGTPCYGNNIEIIKTAENAVSVYLKTAIPTLVNRLFKEKNNRPLISHISDTNALTEFVGKHLFERSPYYQQSNLAINTDDKTSELIVENIVSKLF